MLHPPTRPIRDNLIGRQFTKLFVVWVWGSDGRRIYYRCYCGCGTLVTIAGDSLRSGNTKSCGCLVRQHVIERSTTHGKSHLPIYGAWQRMLQRCYDQNASDYPHYGGRGITVCDAWHTFEGFYRDMGDRPVGMTLERIDNDKNYCPDNCRWATRTEQMQNTRRASRITYQGKTQTVAAWARELGMGRKTLVYRLKHYSLVEAFSKPVKPGAMLNGKNWRQQK